LQTHCELIAVHLSEGMDNSELKHGYWL